MAGQVSKKGREVFGASRQKGLAGLLWRAEGSGGGVEVEEVEPGLGDGALVDFLEGGAIKGELGGVK